jgi:ring-1,2-phenylacetyl-CoA epoxidase subunit PaaE
MSHFHQLAIKDIRRETDHCVSIAFEIPAPLQEEFKYKQGQYITLKVIVKGEELRRSYSICSSPLTDNELRIAVKAIDKGRVSGFLNNGIFAGQKMEVMRPMGNFYVDMPAPTPQHYVAFAAGSGITPIMSLLKTALASHPQNRFTLVYGNRSMDQVIFKSELESLSAKYGTRLAVHHILSRETTTDPLFAGRIDAAKCKQLISRYTDTREANHYFLCGPFDMIQDLRVALKAEGVADEKIHFELFNTPAPDADTPKIPAAPGNSPIAESKVTIILDGDETVVTVTPNTNILDAALDAGLDAPYACTGGSCCTCRAKIVEGHAVMDVNYALTEKEVKQGYILTCQSHPTTPVMVVDYDQP